MVNQVYLVLISVIFVVISIAIAGVAIFIGKQQKMAMEVAQNERWLRELKDIEYKIDEIFINAPHNFIDKKYANSYIIKNLIQYIKENRARTYQEALNLYIEDKKYNNLLNEVYRTQQEARWSNIK